MAVLQITGPERKIRKIKEWIRESDANDPDKLWTTTGMIFRWREVYGIDTYEKFRDLKPNVKYFGPIFWKKRNFWGWLKTARYAMIVISIMDNRTYPEFIQHFLKEFDKGDLRWQ